MIDVREMRSQDAEEKQWNIWEDSGPGVNPKRKMMDMWFHRRLLIHPLQLLHFTINYYLLEIALCGVGEDVEKQGPLCSVDGSVN